MRVRAERAPEPAPDIVVLGTAAALRGACRVRDEAAQGDMAAPRRFDVRFDLDEVVVYAADEYGLLTPGQVGRVALHEIGHALGMLGHSPMPGDRMFAAYRDRSAVASLSTLDIQSFVSLYRVPVGTVFGPAAPPGARPPPARTPPPGPPRLQLAPQVDARRGLSLRVAQGWSAVESEHGIFAANGPVWDYDASLELAVWPHASLAEFDRRYGAAFRRGLWLRRREPTHLGAHTGERLLAEDAAGASAYDVRFFELGDGRVLSVVSRYPLQAEREWAPWFAAMLATLDVRDPDAPGPRLDTGGTEQ